MQDPLRQITNEFINKHSIQKTNSLKQEHLEIAKINQKIINKKQKFNIAQFRKIVKLSLCQIDFGECIPTTIHQKIISINIQQNLPEPITFNMDIICQDQKLNQLPQFVFAIKKDKQFEFIDSYKFRLFSKGKYNFVVGVKTPNFNTYKANSLLKIYCEYSDLMNQSQYYVVKLTQSIKMPTLQSCKQLYFQSQNYQDQTKIMQILKASQSEPKQNIQKVKKQGINNPGWRVLKFSQIRSKLKKQVKIPFKLDTNCKLNLISDLIGQNSQHSQFQKNLIQVKPNQISLSGKGIFIYTFKFSFPQHLVQYLQKLKMRTKNKVDPVSYTLRRILVIRIDQTNIHYHFPVEVKFYLGQNNQKDAAQ